MGFTENQTKRDFGGIYSYKCLECPAKFQQIQEVEKHSFQEHFNFGGDIQWQKSSEINLESLQESLTSEQSQPENKKTAMEESNELTLSKSSPDICIKRQKNGLRVKYPCEDCGKVFKTRFKLNQHISIQHKTGPKMPEYKPKMDQKKEHELVKLHDCPKCEKSYEELKRLSKHISKHHREAK